MTKQARYNHLKHRPYFYNSYHRCFYNFKAIRPWTRRLVCPIIGNPDLCWEFNSRELDAFFSNRQVLSRFYSLAEATNLYPEHFL